MNARLLRMAMNANRATLGGFASRLPRLIDKQSAGLTGLFTAGETWKTAKELCTVPGLPPTAFKLASS